MLKASDETRRIPVVIISGLKAVEDEEKGFLLGALDYITKPFKNTIVKARVGTQIKLIEQMRDIEDLSFIDCLTGIFNRRAFESKLCYEWGRAVRERSLLSLLMIDVDKFKDYNDIYGHQQGDLMLQAVALAIKSALNRSVDIVCRYGGEEFAVILPNVDAAGARAVAERIRISIAALQAPCPHLGVATKATVSIGVATIRPSLRQDSQSLIAQADEMLYAAKANGRNQTCCKQKKAE